MMTNSDTHTIAVGQLRAFIERYERLDSEKKAINEDQKELVSELKGTGFDVKAFKEIIRLRKKDEHERSEEDAILQLYLEALGMA